MKKQFITYLMVALAVAIEFVFGNGTGVLAATAALTIADTDSEEVKKAKGALIAAKDAAVAEAKTLLEKAIKPDSTEFKSAIETILKASLSEITVKQGDKDVMLAEAFKSMQSQFDELATKFNESGSIGGNGKVVTFHDSFAKAISDNTEVIQNIARGKADQKTGRPGGSIELKDMSFGNFGTGAYEAITTETRPGVYASPFTPVWLRNIVPNGSTTSEVIQYLRENGGTGAAAVWDSRATPLENKPDVQFNFSLVSEEVEWIAGLVRLPRQMLMDAAFLNTYIPNQLLYGRRGILVAENDLIYTALTDPANSTAYDGNHTNPVEIIYDAALGQIRDNYFAATHVLMNNRDVVNLIALNKATGGSEEYDLPPGLSAVINGQLTIGGIPVVGLPQIPQGEFVAFDNRATQFVSRMSPEVRFFEEDRDNVPKNLITVRAEERAAFLVFDALAVITGSFGS